VRAAVDWAEVAAMLGDYAEAVEWLGVVESIDGGLSPELAALRMQWMRDAAKQSPRGPSTGQ
jgi:hypothetical protein